MYKDKTVLLVAAIYRGLVNVKRTGIHIAMSDNRINFQIDRTRFVAEQTLAATIGFTTVGLLTRTLLR